MKKKNFIDIKKKETKTYNIMFHYIFKNVFWISLLVLVVY